MIGSQRRTNIDIYTYLWQQQLLSAWCRQQLHRLAEGLRRLTRLSFSVPTLSVPFKRLSTCLIQIESIYHIIWKRILINGNLTAQIACTLFMFNSFVSIFFNRPSLPPRQPLTRLGIQLYIRVAVGHGNRIISPHYPLDNRFRRVSLEVEPFSH